MWVIRGGENNRLVDRFTDQGVIALGFPQVPDAEILTRTEIRRFIADVHAPGALDQQVAMLSAFVREVQVGDSVLMPDTPRGEVVVGTITGPYVFHEDLPAEDFRHRRTVDWLARHAIADLPAAVQAVHKQRFTLQQHRDAEWSSYLAQVRDGSIGRDPANRVPQPTRAAPRPRSPGTPRVVKPVIAQRTCTSCFLQTHPDRMRGDICVDCAE